LDIRVVAAAPNHVIPLGFSLFPHKNLNHIGFHFDENDDFPSPTVVI